MSHTHSAACDPKIAIVPFRYSAGPTQRQDNESNDPNAMLPTWKEAGLTTLEDGFPELQKMRYNLRLIEEGMFIYLFDETQMKYFAYEVQGDFFTELVGASKGIEGVVSGDGIPYKRGHGRPFIYALEESVVHVMMTDALLTQRMAGNILKNTDGLRDKLTTKIDGKSWNKGSPQTHTFHYEKAPSVVEELMNVDVSFSPFERTSTAAAAARHLEQMRGEMVCPSSKDKQIAVALHDNICMAADVKATYAIYAKRLDDYVDAERPPKAREEAQKRQRKAVVAELIEQLYKMKFAQETGIKNPTPELVEQRLDTAARNELGRKRKDATPENMREAREGILSSQAEPFIRHVKEDERRAFVKAYNAEFNRLHKEAVIAKNDWATLLETYEKKNSPRHLGATFLRYDLTNDDTSTVHATNFSCVTDGMLGGNIQAPEGVVDKAQELYLAWMDKDGMENPILANMEYDKGFASRLFVGEGDVVSAAGATGGHVFGKFTAINILSTQVAVYQVSGPAMKGLKKLENKGKILEHMKSISKRTDKIVEYLSLNKFKGRVKKEMVPYEEIRAIVFEGKEMPQNTVSGTLYGTSKTLEKNGKGMVEVTTWNEGVKAPKWVKGAENLSKGATPVVALFAVKNLITAVENFEVSGFNSQSFASVVSLAGEIAGVGLAANMGAQAFEKKLMASIPEHSKRFRVYKFVKGSLGLKLFGYGGAIADGVHYSAKAWGQFSEGNIEAGISYAAGAVGYAAGGFALTKGGLLWLAVTAPEAAAGGAAVATAGGAAGASAVVPVAGWIIAGVILVGIGVYFVMRAEGQEFTEINYWLNNSSFGKHKKMGDHPVEEYDSLSEESKAFAKALNAVNAPKPKPKKYIPLTPFIMFPSGDEWGNERVEA